MTTTNLAEIHASAAAAFADLVADINDAQWNDPTPCEGWSVRDLVNHVVAGNFWAAELTRATTIDQVGDRLDGDVLGSHPSETSRQSAEIASDAFRADGAMQAPCAVSYGPIPGEVYCGHRILDLVGHAWDLASATRQNTDLDPAHVTAALEILEPQFEMLAASGQFGDAADPGDAVEPQERLLRMLGRHRKPVGQQPTDQLIGGRTNSSS